MSLFYIYIHTPRLSFNQKQADLLLCSFHLHLLYTHVICRHRSSFADGQKRPKRQQEINLPFFTFYCDDGIYLRMKSNQRGLLFMHTPPQSICCFIFGYIHPDQRYISKTKGRSRNSKACYDQWIKRAIYKSAQWKRKMSGKTPKRITTPIISFVCTGLEKQGCRTE